jgi:hypothetical protein
VLRSPYPTVEIKDVGQTISINQHAGREGTVADIGGEREGDLENPNGNSSKSTTQTSFSRKRRPKPAVSTHTDASANGGELQGYSGGNSSSHINRTHTNRINPDANPANFDPNSTGNNSSNSNGNDNSSSVPSNLIISNAVQDLDWYCSQSILSGDAAGRIMLWDVETRRLTKIFFNGDIENDEFIAEKAEAEEKRIVAERRKKAKREAREEREGRVQGRRKGVKDVEEAKDSVKGESVETGKEGGRRECRGEVKEKEAIVPVELSVSPTAAEAGSHAHSSPVLALEVISHARKEPKVRRSRSSDSKNSGRNGNSKTSETRPKTSETLAIIQSRDGALRFRDLSTFREVYTPIATGKEISD